MKNAVKKTHAVLSSSSYKISSESSFDYVESYNQLRTNVMFSLAALYSSKKAIIVSSAHPSECKSTVSANLAISLAKLKQKVLVIDADLRRPNLHRIFGVHNERGLSDVILSSSVDNAIIGIGGLNLDFLPAGTIPPNPSELLGSAAVAELISTLEKIYDYIIIDTPPILVVSDALMLSRVAAGMLISCRYKKTTYNDFDKVLNALNLAKFPVIGAVIVGSKKGDDLRMIGKHNGYGYSYCNKITDK